MTWARMPRARGAGSKRRRKFANVTERRLTPGREILSSLDKGLPPDASLKRATLRHLGKPSGGTSLAQVSECPQRKTTLSQRCSTDFPGVCLISLIRNHC